MFFQIGKDSFPEPWLDHIHAFKLEVSFSVSNLKWTSIKHLRDAFSYIILVFINIIKYLNLLIEAFEILHNFEYDYFLGLSVLSWVDLSVRSLTNFF